MNIPTWITARIDNLHLYEAREMALPVVGRDQAVAGWIIRCLANPHCAGSAEILAMIAERRAEVAV